MTKGKSVVIIDDDDIYQYTAKRTLRATDLAHTIVSFTNGQDAMDYFTANVANTDILPDIVFLDLNMPIADGWQFLEHYESIKSLIKKKLSIYITSSSKNPEDLIQAKKHTTVTGYLIKPASIGDYKSLLEQE